MKQNGNKKEYYVVFDHIHSGIRLLDTLYGEDYTLFVPKINNKIINETKSDYEHWGINIQSLVVKIQADNPESAHFVAYTKSHKIMAYLAGIYQVSFFFTLVDSIFNYSVYDGNPIEKWKKYQIVSPLINGKNTIYTIGNSKKNCILVKKLPNFKKYEKYEDIFYLWRSAEDLFNELGWRILNYIRIIELITKTQRGGGKKAKRMYDALPQNSKSIITENDFITVIIKWGNPVAHGNIPGAVIPKIPRGGMNQDQDTSVLSKIIKVLIKDYIYKMQ